MRINILDHGYVELIEPWGTGRGSHATLAENTEMVAYQGPDFEVGIIEAARQSTQGAFRGWDEDAKLLKHLYNNQHSTPFEFAGMVLEVQAPIFVFREWHRHRTQSYNEMSARYAPLPDLYYEPEYDVVLERAKAASASRNKMEQGIAPWTDDETAGFWLEALDQTYRQCERVYQTAMAKGIPKELARLVMPVGHYSRMRASANLRNWLAFMTLRCDPNAQWEIRQYALATEELIKHTFPKTHSLWATKFWV